MFAPGPHLTKLWPWPGYSVPPCPLSTAMNIVWLTFDIQATQNTKTKLSETFVKYDLILTYRDINTTEEKYSWNFLILPIKFLPIPSFDSSLQTTLNQKLLIVALFKVPHTTQLLYLNRLCLVNQIDFDD